MSSMYMQFTSFASEEKEERALWAVIEIVLSQAEDEEERGGWRCQDSQTVCFKFFLVFS